jgi:hypothetical protein
MAKTVSEGSDTNVHIVTRSSPRGRIRQTVVVISLIQTGDLPQSSSARDQACPRKISLKYRKTAQLLLRALRFLVRGLEPDCLPGFSEWDEAVPIRHQWVLGGVSRHSHQCIMRMVRDHAHPTRGAIHRPGGHRDHRRVGWILWPPEPYDRESLQRVRELSCKACAYQYPRGCLGTSQAFGTPHLPWVSSLLPSAIPLRIHVPLQLPQLQDSCLCSFCPSLPKNQLISGLVPKNTHSTILQRCSMADVC